MKKWGRKGCLWVAMCAAILWCMGGGTVQAAAQETTAASWETMPQGYGEWEDSLPDDLKELLPEDLFSKDAGEAYEAVRGLASVKTVVQTILQLVGVRLSESIGLLATLMGLILLAAVLRHVQQAIGGKGADMFGFCVRLTLFAAMVTQGVLLLQGVEAYFSQLQTLTAAMVPVMGTLYAMGGNLTQAVATQEILLMVLTVCQYVGSQTLLPMCGICFGLALMDAFKSSVQFGALAGLIKKWYTSLLGILMMIFTTVLSVQTVLTSRADTLQMKGVKYAVGQMVPVVGGAVSGTLGTVAAGVGVLRSVCGVCGVILIALLLLPTLVQILLYRAVFQMAGTAAGMLHCDGEAGLLASVAGLYGYVAAVVSICAVVFVIALSIFMSGATAIG